MDFPIFHLDLLNNRLLIAFVAIIHVLINHGMAVGGIPVVVMLERKGLVTGDSRWTDLARRLMTFFFVITTTLGALSGVGIWFSVTLVNPTAISSLLRVFFWTWAVEWGVFVSEVCLILAYQLSWGNFARTKPRQHLRLGVVLALASWATMMLIVSILAFMMDTGSWQTKRTLLSGMLNPLYLPQLAFRTPLAMVLAGALSLPLVSVFTRDDKDFRSQSIRAVSKWLLFWLPFCLLGAWWYARRVPVEMAKNMPVALLTQGLAAWSGLALKVATGVVAAVALVASWGAIAPRTLKFWGLIIPTISMLWLVAHFERVREFVRKPYAIPHYLYANGIREEDYPLLRKEGLLAHAAFVTGQRDDGEAEAGKQIFLLACSRCHTTDGVNGLRGLLGSMYGIDRAWDAEAISAYVDGMHRTRPFMPPFPGSIDDRKALGEFLVTLQRDAPSIDGAQTAGVRPAMTRSAVNESKVVLALPKGGQP